MIQVKGMPAEQRAAWEVPTEMSGLIDLPNLGKVVVSQLEHVGITTPAELRRLGSVEAALRLSKIGVEVCSSKLSALEGAIRGVRWHSIPADERAALKDEFDARC